MEMEINKKGAIFGLPIIAFVIAVIVLIVVLSLGSVALMFTNLRWYLIGGGIIFVTLIFGLKGNYTPHKGKIILTLIIIGLAILMIPIFGLQQTFLGVSQFKTDDGKGYWLITGVADSIGDRAEFVSHLPNEGILSDGTKVIPKDPLRLTISKGTSQCEYQLIRRTKSIWVSPLRKHTVIYYDVASPERVINAVFSDDRGNSKIIDGTVTQNVVFTDRDGKGKAVITTVGSFAGKQSCPSSSNLVILKAGESNLLSTTEYLDRAQFIAFLDERDTWLGTFRFKDVSEIKDNLVFMNAFASGSLTITSTNKLIGTGRSLGNIMYTITADRDYFNSVIITPAKPAVPQITSLDCPDNIGSSGSASVKVNIKNNGDPGNINIRLSSTDFSFNPSAVNMLLDKTGSYTAGLTAGSVAKNRAQITATVCGVSQISGGQCDTKTCTVNIVADPTPSHCPNGICDPWENHLTCPQDCPAPTTPSPTEGSMCRWYEDEIPNQHIIRRWYHYVGIGTPTVVTTGTKCVTASWVYLVAGIGVILILGLTLIIVWKPTKKRKKK